MGGGQVVTSERRSRVSIEDVAAAAGVSIGTVSNVLNHPGRVTTATSERVHATIQRLGYVRNGMASQLRAGTRTAVGAIVLDIRNPFFTEVTRGIEDELAQAGCTLMIASSDGDVEREHRFLRLFEEHAVAGIIVVPSGPDAEPLVALAKRGVGVVVLDATLPNLPLSSVAVDDVEGGRLAVAHLLARGHQRVHVVTGSTEVRQTRDRLLGARHACADAGLDSDETLVPVHATTLDSAGGEQAMGAWVDRYGQVPEAIFAMNDLLAIGVQRSLRRRDRYAPEHTAVVGYDDIDLAAELLVPLTSVRQPTLALGAKAAELLVTSPPDSPQQVVFQPELVIRASSTA